MMAAFIVAIRGTVVQAVLLGLAATVSHTAVVVGGGAARSLFRFTLGPRPKPAEPHFQAGLRRA